MFAPQNAPTMVHHTPEKLRKGFLAKHPSSNRGMASLVHPLPGFPRLFTSPSDASVLRSVGKSAAL